METRDENIFMTSSEYITNFEALRLQRGITICKALQIEEERSIKKTHMYTCLFYLKFIFLLVFNNCFVLIHDSSTPTYVYMYVEYNK